MYNFRGRTPDLEKIMKYNYNLNRKIFELTHQIKESNQLKETSQKNYQMYKKMLEVKVN